MSRLIINRFFKPSLCKNFLRHTSIGHARLLSSTTHTSTGSDSDSDTDTTTNWSYSPYRTSRPYLLVDHILETKDDGLIKDKRLLIKDKRLLNEVCDAMTAGFSRDGLDFSPSYISYNPSNPKLKSMQVHLPDLPVGTQIQNMAISSLPTRDKNWVVGVKFSGSSRVSFCRPYGSCQWIDAKTKPQSIHPFASIMYSKKDKRFYVPTPGGNHLCSFDPNSKEEKDQIDFIELEFEDLPKSVFDDLADVSSCSKTEHLVESPTGQLFLVKWYGENEEEYYESNYETKIKHSVKRFMVFRVDGSMWFERSLIYTEDIGDLCIFLGHSEAFCVPASSSPGLEPNCIYFVGYNFGTYDLTTKKCTIFRDKDGNSLSRTDFPYWPPPVPLN